MSGRPIYDTSFSYSTITISANGNPTPGVPPLHVQYEVDTAVVKSSDTLNLYTFDGKDTVKIDRTQPEDAYVSTGGGDDTITVGVGNLDDIIGPLVVDAGGAHNQISFLDFGSTNGDTATLATNLKPDPNIVPASLGPISQQQIGNIGYLLRYKGESLVGNPDQDSIHSASNPSLYRFPLALTFLATGGDYANGVIFDATLAADQIYVDSVLPNAPTTIGTGGGADNVYVGFDGGANAAPTDPNSTLNYIYSKVKSDQQNIEKALPNTKRLVILDMGRSIPKRPWRCSPA